MNRDAMIVQVAILMIIIAIIGVAILQQQRKGYSQEANRTSIVPVKEAEYEIFPSVDQSSNTGEEVVVDKEQVPVVVREIENSARANIVKQYFSAIASENYTQACEIMSNGKCSASKPVAVASFAREFSKLQNGYEYVNVKDYGFVAPSGKQIVCVKYSYRYKEDARPGLVSEVLSFYLNDEGGELKITDRVCEKKYKDGRGLRDCPIEAAAEFCEGRVK